MTKIPRKIIHLDMDCFYAAVEMQEYPEFIGKPLAVGGEGRRSVICTCNYEARAFGVRSGMPGFMGLERCPGLVFLPVRMELYRAVAQRVHEIFYEYTQLVEPLSLDEAFLDVTQSKRYAWDIAKEIRARIKSATGLTASAGIAPNKMLAKIASDWRKPNRQFAILPHQVKEFMAPLSIRKIWGIGPKSAQRLEVVGIKTCSDLQRLTRFEIAQYFSKWGEELYHLCRGEDHREVVPHRPRKSLSNEKTFSENLLSLQQCRLAIAELASQMLVEWRLEASLRRIRKAFIKIKFSDFSKTTKECLCAEPNEAIYQTLLEKAYERKKLPVRLLGAGVRFADEEDFQGELF
ncbi:MAG: DNA polymerase IV [Chthoniobacterales bacterium]